MDTTSFFAQSAAMIEHGDLGIFKIITQTYDEDKIALLALQNIVRAHVPAYT